MIKRFGTVFAGHVDMDDIGFDGIPVNDRVFPNEHLATVFDKTTAIAQLMDRTGWDTLWLAEHQFQREGFECIPNIPLLAVHLCHVTERIRVGSAFNITPMWHPLRLAMDYATADILTGGRLIFGVGRGYHTREVEVFGAPMLDGDANRDLFEEQVDIIFKAFNEESFSHHGKHYDIPPPVPYRGYELEEITMVPRPINLPVECWQPIVSAGQRGLDFMVRHGIKGMIGGGAAAGGATDNVLRAWQEAHARTGREIELGEDLIIGYNVFIAESQEKAIDMIRPYFQENMKMFGPLGFVRGLTDDQIDALGDPARIHSAGLPTIEQAVEGGGVICGPPDQVIEKLAAVQEAYPGLEQVNVGYFVSTPEKVILEQMERFAEEVMPAFKSKVAAPAADN